MFLSIMRANAIAARALSGHFLSVSPEPRTYNSHVMAEFYDARLGWVPVECTSKFGPLFGVGANSGSIIVRHFDFDYRVPVPAPVLDARRDRALLRAAQEPDRASAVLEQRCLTVGRILARWNEDEAGRAMVLAALDETTVRREVVDRLGTYAAKSRAGEPTVGALDGHRGVAHFKYPIQGNTKGQVVHAVVRVQLTRGSASKWIKQVVPGSNEENAAKAYAQLEAEVPLPAMERPFFQREILSKEDHLDDLENSTARVAFHDTYLS